MNWELLWKVVLLATLAAFAAMAVLVTIGGARDIRRLLRRLGDDEQRRKRRG
jgi:hypothetical protein